MSNKNKTKDKSKNHKNSNEKNEETNWENVTGFMQLLSMDPKFRIMFPLNSDLKSALLTLDYLDDGVDLSDPHQLHSFLSGLLEPLKMLFYAYQDGELEYEQIRYASIAISAAFTVVYNYLPREHFALFMESDCMDTEGR